MELFSIRIQRTLQLVSTYNLFYTHSFFRYTLISNFPLYLLYGLST